MALKQWAIMLGIVSLLLLLAGCGRVAERTATAAKVTEPIPLEQAEELDSFLDVIDAELVLEDAAIEETPVREPVEDISDVVEELEEPTFEEFEELELE